MEYLFNNMNLSKKGYLLLASMCLTSITIVACCSNKSIKLGTIIISNDKSLLN